MSYSQYFVQNSVGMSSLRLSNLETPKEFPKAAYIGFSVWGGLERNPQALQPSVWPPAQIPIYPTRKGCWANQSAKRHFVQKHPPSRQSMLSIVGSRRHS